MPGQALSGNLVFIAEETISPTDSFGEDNLLEKFILCLSYCEIVNIPGRGGKDRSFLFFNVVRV
jgi:hypothetical protein